MLANTKVTVMQARLTSSPLLTSRTALAGEKSCILQTFSSTATEGF